ncbi:MAG TPA: DUF2059 domain-containing protein [Erythrobacter sp.]|nr:DUF2059 domain-containing protein [Erythrobacter sp.]
MKSVMLAACAGLALIATPAATLSAQEAEATDETVMVDDPARSPVEDEMATITQMFAGLFTKEPLTPEQEARLPAAEQLIAKVIPAGTMGEMIDKMMGGVLGPMMAMGPDGATSTIAEKIGTEPYALDLTEEQAGELASLFDPAWAERQQREMAMIPDMMKEMVALTEPGMRKAMSELYAIRFSQSELEEINAFFSTGTGGKYARESFLMASDPRIMASTMEAMPALMGSIGDIEKRMADSLADLPAVRSFADLSPAERAKVAETTGLTIEEIEANLKALEFDYEVEEAYSTDEEVAAADAALAAEAERE